MKKSYLFLLFFFLGIILYGQTPNETYNVMKREYEYDSAGNRTVRKVLVLPKTSITSSTSPGHKSAGDINDKDEIPLIDRMEDIKLKIYPNPTTSIVNINIENVEELQEGMIHIYSVSGTQIGSQLIESLHTSVDLSAYSRGIYLITIRINGKETKWKIIKE